ncbi:S8 family peptidase [Ideonella sp. BN130291]|nr:S8 family peptidase [Ideonella sp. BN130291]
MFGKTRKMQLSACAAAVTMMLATTVWAGGSETTFGATATSAAQAQAEPTDRMIVKYRDVQATIARSARLGPVRADRLAALQAFASQHGAVLSHLRNNALGAHILKLDRRLSPEQAAALAARLKASDPSIEYAEPDRIMQPLLTPNDSQFASQWDFHEATAGINAPAAWDLSTGSGVTVAVIDTGYRPHADLAANIVAGYDFINDAAVGNDGNTRDSNPQDPGDWVTSAESSQSGGPFQGCRVSNSSWHGTHVAGTVAAVTNNGTGVAGVAFNAKVQPARVLGKCGGYTSDIADAIIWTSGGSVSGVPANATPSRVLNLSLGGSGSCDTTTQNAINSARSRNAVVVVAAGNSNANAANFSPASCSGIVTVAAVGRTGARASYSNYGSVVALAAPGGDGSNSILSTLNSGTTSPGSDSYAGYQGTSMASPHVAGVAALMIAKKPSATVDEVISKLKSTARPFPATCSQCGTGLLDARAAVAAMGTIDPPPGTNEVEPNNSQGTANFQSAPVTLNAAMGSSTDQDWFSLDLPAGRTLSVTMTPNSSSDYDLYVYNSNGTLIGSSEKGAGAVDSVSVTNTGSSTFKRYVKVIYYSGGTGSTNGKYTVKLAW